MRSYYGSKLSSATTVHAARAANEALIAAGGQLRCAALDGKFPAESITYAIEHRWFYRVITDGIAYYVTNSPEA